MNQPTSLQELAQLVIDHQGQSARQIALKASKLDLKLTYTTLNQMRSGTYRWEPREDTIRALAQLAGVSDEVAFTAAGKPVPGPPLADELPPGSDNLSPRSRAAVIDMLRVLIDLEQTNEQHSTARDHNDPERVGLGAGPAAGASEKTGPAGLPEDFDLAAHPPMKLARDAQDDEFDRLGEESQDDR